MPDEIHILGLEMPSRIGVPDEECASWQSLSADIRLTLRRDFDAMPDNLAATVDYERAARDATQLAADRPRKLLEVLAADLARHFLADDAITAVDDIVARVSGDPIGECVASAVDVAAADEHQVLDLGRQRVADAATHGIDATTCQFDDVVETGDTAAGNIVDDVGVVAGATGQQVRAGTAG